MRVQGVGVLCGFRVSDEHGEHGFVADRIQRRDQQLCKPVKMRLPNGVRGLRVKLIPTGKHTKCVGSWGHSWGLQCFLVGVRPALGMDPTPAVNDSPKAFEDAAPAFNDAGNTESPLRIDSSVSALLC